MGDLHMVLGENFWKLCTKDAYGNNGIVFSRHNTEFASMNIRLSHED